MNLSVKQLLATQAKQLVNYNGFYSLTLPHQHLSRNNMTAAMDAELLQVAEG